MDATIHDMNRSLNSFVRQGKSFYCAGDTPNWNSRFNAGVWFVLSNHQGRQIMNSWMNLYDSGKWTKETDGSWKTIGEWAGDTYEQGSFVQTILPRFNTHIEVLPWQVLQSFIPLPQSFTLHFAGPEKSAWIQSYFT